MEINWNKAPEDAKAALVAKRGNVHYPKTIFVKDFYTCGDTIQATSCDGRKLDPYISSWDLIERPANAEWSGEGLPPVGTMVEVHYSDQAPYEALVVAEHLGEVVLWIGNGARTNYWRCDPAWLRPILTPEQRAAKERDEAVAAMLGIAGQVGIAGDAITSVAEALYAAGWRKVEWPELDDE